VAKKTWGYTRVSTQRQALQGVSLEAQEQQCRDYHKFRLEPQGYVIGGFFTDTAHSGGKAMLDRPGGKSLCAAADTGDAIVISRLDRGFRNLRDMLSMVDVWKGRGISLHLLDLSVDTSTDIGRLMLSVIGAVAEFEKNIRNERVRLTLARLKEQGFHTTGMCPYGFKVVGPRCGRRLVTDKAQRELGRKLLQWRKDGWSFEQILIHCWKSKIFGRYGGQLSRSSVQKFMSGEVKLQRLEAEETAAKAAKAAAAKVKAEAASPPTIPLKPPDAQTVEPKKENSVDAEPRLG
jgi:DNA invertase Pin-like site-specific DNA recombinase